MKLHFVCIAKSVYFEESFAYLKGNIYIRSHPFTLGAFPGAVHWQEPFHCMSKTASSRLLHVWSVTCYLCRSTVAMLSHSSAALSAHSFHNIQWALIPLRVLLWPLETRARNQGRDHLCFVSVPVKHSSFNSVVVTHVNWTSSISSSLTENRKSKLIPSILLISLRIFFFSGYFNILISLLRF